MSAFVVGKSEIDVLVAAGIQVVGDQVGHAHADEVGQRLLDECVRSVSFRYPDDDLGELPGSYVEESIVPGVAPVSVAEWLTPYAFTRPAGAVTRELVADTLGTYEYQACEHPGWLESWACSYCAGLRGQLDGFPQSAPERPAPPDPGVYGDLSRDETIRRIRVALRRRSGKAWSVTGGRGTAWGWIHIQSPPKRRVGFGYMTEADQRELGELLGLDRPVHCQGQSIAASSEYRREYIDRAEGRVPATHGTPYWD
jgi:hypothetical protein